MCIKYHAVPLIYRQRTRIHHAVEWIKNGTETVRMKTIKVMSTTKLQKACGNATLLSHMQTHIDHSPKLNTPHNMSVKPLTVMFIAPQHLNGRCEHSRDAMCFVVLCPTFTHWGAQLLYCCVMMCLGWKHMCANIVQLTYENTFSVFIDLQMELANPQWNMLIDTTWPTISEQADHILRIDSAEIAISTHGIIAAKGSERVAITWRWPRSTVSL